MRGWVNTQIGLENQEPDFLQFKVTAGSAAFDLRTLDPGQMVEVDHDLSTIFEEPLGGVEVRFTASRDGELMEVALDDFVVLADLESAGAAEGGLATVYPAVSCLITPNPVRSEATVRFSTQAIGPVRLTVHDVSGRLIATLLDGDLLPPGVHWVLWDGRSDRGYEVQSGIYYVRMYSRSAVASRLLVFVR